ncbi:MAG: hypothetical protein DWQ31_16935 [Planctomycetota bacterium]|nr:MAG: hypothetical protein DWQ31_16935 [Planctomycetota bacterium]REJ92040.1 MAG: hypothetical protein DWQ35_12885 [Planctomycetota bacterium]
MALRWIEGFELFGDVIGNNNTSKSNLHFGLATKYVTAGTSTSGSDKPFIVAGRRGGFAMQFSTDNNTRFERDFGSTFNDDTIITGLAVKFADIGSSAFDFLTFHDANGQVNGLGIALNGKIKFNDTEATAAEGMLVAGAWYYIELRCRFSQTVGEYELRVNGVTVLSATGVDTLLGLPGSSPTIIRWQNKQGFTGLGAIDDIYVLDNTGASNNDFLGLDTVVEGIFPSADGDLTDWTPSSGSDHYALVDEPAFSSSDYVESDAANEKDLYQYEDLVLINGSIFGVQVNTISRVQEPNVVIDTKNLVKSGTTEEESTFLEADSESSTTYPSVHEQDPDTATPWTIASVNSAQFGVKNEN